jgi:tetratricopeptide (TPR) repeat protein
MEPERSQDKAKPGQSGAVCPKDGPDYGGRAGVAVSAGRTRKPLPAQLTDAQRGFYTELRRLTALAGFSARSLERPAVAGSIGGYGRARWDRWLNGETRPPIQVVRSLAEMLERLDIEAAHLPGLWTQAFADAPPPAAGQAPPPRPYQLPPAVAHFTGRAAELQTLTGLADQASGSGGAVVITAIGGTAGVGKTALAVHWAHHAAGRFPDGELYVNLRGYDPSGEPVQPDEAVRWLLEALAVPAAQIPSGPQAQTGLYRSLLAGQKMLIVLDNARDPAQVRPLLPGTPGSMVLVTSRSQLTGLAAADGAALIDLDVLGSDEARILLARRLGAARLAAEPAAVSDLVRLCARLPLALNIAAALAAAQPERPLAALAGDLHGHPAPLDALDTGDAASSVRTVFSWSYHSLPPAPASMFRLLGLHPGPDISPAAAASLAGIPAGQARQALRELAAAHLLAEHAPGRYAFHDLLRAYAAEQAARCDDKAARAAAVSRMLDHYLHTATAAAALLCPGRDLLKLSPPRAGVTPEPVASGNDALAWFTAERPVLTAAVTQAAEAGLGAPAWQLGWTVGRFLHRRGYRQEWIATLQTALAAAQAAADITGQAYVHRDLGAACAVNGAVPDAAAHLQQAMDLYRQLGDRPGQAHTYLYLCMMSGVHGQPREALEHAGRALQLFRAAGHVAGQANALSNAAYSHDTLGEHEQALACCLEALPLHEQSGNRDGEGHAWSCLSSTYHHLGRHDEAIDCDRRSVMLFRDLGDQHLLADALTQLGDHLQDSGSQQEARTAWQEAFAILDDLRHPAAGQVRARLSGPGPAVAV